MKAVHEFFFFNDTATTEIYTLSLHDALPICPMATHSLTRVVTPARRLRSPRKRRRSEEHTSELQSPCNLVCRLLLEKKNNHLRVTNDHDLPAAHHPWTELLSGTSVHYQTLTL